MDNQDIVLHICNYVNIRTLLNLEETCTKYRDKIRINRWSHLIVRIESVENSANV